MTFARSEWRTRCEIRRWSGYPGGGVVPLGKAFNERVEDRAWRGLARGVDLDATTIVEDDLPSGESALSGGEVAFIELAGEHQDAVVELGFQGAAGPAVLPGVDVERLVWRG